MLDLTSRSTRFIGHYSSSPSLFTLQYVWINKLLHFIRVTCLERIPALDQHSFPAVKDNGAAEESLAGKMLRQRRPCVMQSET